MARTTSTAQQLLRDELATLQAQDEQRQADRPFQHTTDERAKACPFCGADPELSPWHGGSPTKIMIACENDDCPLQPSTTGETTSEALEKWNTRANA